RWGTAGGRVGGGRQADRRRRGNRSLSPARDRQRPMIPIDGQVVLTAKAMRAAEQVLFDGGMRETALMQRAGEAVAQSVARLAAGREVLVLCGPGNNGGDGYVAAASLRRQGLPVRVTASGEPRSESGRWARSLWEGGIETLDTAGPAPVLVDALFGTGLSRALDGSVQAALSRLASAAGLRIAVDLPSGVATDDGQLLGEVPRFDVTLALGAVKPAHLLQPAAQKMGHVRLLDIGVPVDGGTRVLAKPWLPEPNAASHKYSRGLVTIVAGAMSGASK